MRVRSRWMLFWGLVLVGIAVILGACGGGGGSTETETGGPAGTGSPAVGAKPPAFTLHALSEVESDPVVRELRNLGIVISRDHVPDEDGIIVDGAASSVEALEAGDVVGEAIRKGQAVIFLNASDEHKRAMIKHVGIAFSGDWSRAYSVFPDPGSFGRHFTIIDHPRFVPFDPADITVDGQPVPIPVNHALLGSSQSALASEIANGGGPRQYAALLHERLSKNALVRAGLAREVDPNLPAGLKNCRWAYRTSASKRIDNLWWRSPYALIHADYTSYLWNNLVLPATSPMTGYQTASISPTTYIYLYLDNSPTNVSGNHQWLVVDHQGVSKPADGPNSTASSTSVAMPMNGEKDYPTYSDEGFLTPNVYAWAYAQMGCFFSFSPQFSDFGNLHYYSAQPDNVSGVTSYTSGYNFLVNFSLAGAAGSAGVIRSTTTSIPDWSVVNGSSPTGMAFRWNWRSTNPPYNGNYHYQNQLNVGYFEPKAHGVLQTYNVRRDVLEFSMQSGINQISGDWKVHGLIPLQYPRMDMGSLYDSRTVDVDFNAVLYPLLQSLAISPGQVQGGTSTTGTVTLDTNAPDGGAVVELTSSNTAWATVPATATVPGGQASQAFPITTLPVSGGNVVVTVTASLNNLSRNATLTITP